MSSQWLNHAAAAILPLLLDTAVKGLVILVAASLATPLMA